MRFLKYVLVIFTMIQLAGCDNYSSESDVLTIIDDCFTIREIPMRIESPWDSEMKRLKIFFAIETDKERVNEKIQDSIDHFVCEYIDTVNIEDYLTFSISFLKETDETRRINGEKGITDSNNPISSEHYFFIEYFWKRGTFYEKIINEYEEKEDLFLCD